MKKYVNFIVYSFCVSIILLNFMACVGDMGYNNNLSRGWNDEPIAYCFSIKDTTLPYLYLTDYQKEKIEGYINGDDMFIIKKELQKITDELISLYPPNHDGENEYIAEKIDGTVSWLNNIIAINNINTIRESYFIKYRYVITDLVSFNCYWIKGQKRKLENAVTIGDNTNFNKNVKEYYSMLVSNPEDNAIYRRIISTINWFNDLLSIQVKSVKSLEGWFNKIID